MSVSNTYMRESLRCDQSCLDRPFDQYASDGVRARVEPCPCTREEGTEDNRDVYIASSTSGKVDVKECL